MSHTSQAGGKPTNTIAAMRLSCAALRSTWWWDTSRQLTVQEVEQRQNALPFALRGPAHRLRLCSSGALWVRFDAWSQDPASHRELELARSGTDRISLDHREADGRWQAAARGRPRRGARLAFARPFPSVFTGPPHQRPRDLLGSHRTRPGAVFR